MILQQMSVFQVAKDFILGKAVILLLLVITSLGASNAYYYWRFHSAQEDLKIAEQELEICSQNVRTVIETFKSEDAQNEIDSLYLERLQARILDLIDQCSKRLPLEPYETKPSSSYFWQDWIDPNKETDGEGGFGRRIREGSEKEEDVERARLRLN